jgi:hypothetical protein
MTNIDLSEEEYNLIINYRKSKYNIDITENEYQMILSNRNGGMKVYEKYIENIQKFIDQDNSLVSEKSKNLMTVVRKLCDNLISLDDYKNLGDITYNGGDEDTKFKIGCLNYIKNSIALHYPN